MMRSWVYSTYFACMTGLCLGGLGCAGNVVVRATLRYPAALSIPGDADVVVVRGLANEDVELAEPVRRFLASGSEREVRVVPVDVWAGANRREPGRDRETAVVRLDLSLRETTSRRWSTVPETVCGAFGCSTQDSTRLVQVPETRGSVTMDLNVMSSGVGGHRVESEAMAPMRFVVRAEAAGFDVEAVRRSVVAQLARQIEPVLLGEQRRLRVVLLDVQEVAGVRLAIREAEEGDWLAARERLMALVAEPRIDALADSDRARVYYDLGVMQRFAADANDPDSVWVAAEASFATAIRLDSRWRYREALVELRNDRIRRVERLVRQRRWRAVQTRPRLDPERRAIPEAPAAYRDGSALVTPGLRQ